MLGILTVVFVYWFAQTADAYLGFQTLTRPIVLGTITGLFCGDIKEGIVMGTALEATYMGISSIGGVQASNYQAATVLAVGLKIISGIDVGTSMALAVTVGTLMTAEQPITNALTSLCRPIFIKLAQAGKVREYRIAMWIQQIFLSQLVNSVTLLVCMAVGSTVISNAMDAAPAFILRGLQVSASVLVVVGLCLTTQAIWAGASTVLYVLLGFVAYEYLGLGTLPIAIIGIVICYAQFKRSYQLSQMKMTAPVAAATGIEEGDDFFE